MYNEFGVPHEVFESAKFKALSDRARLLYCYLAKAKNRFADVKGWFWRAVDTLADDVGKSSRAVKYAKRELIDSGLIEIRRGYYHKGQRACDYYRLNGFSFRKK